MVQQINRCGNCLFATKKINVMNDSNKITLQSLGAAQTVTGSKHLLRTPELTLLVDCGLFQGIKTLREKNDSLADASFHAAKGPMSEELLIHPVTGEVMPPATPAATMVIFRNNPEGGPPLILMVERVKSMAFAGGMVVCIKWGF